ncbi:MAG: fused MFS/spermidine synthase [Betaproteobacteria bacterium]|nr:fused MFS/spermidine synthase [Betaproteobacteria bacterium]MDH5286921.1 fused MFS/spermidine synthase [Betaproteobacteria bacterium]
MLLYAATIFVSAFLLFLVQPVMAKQILPWFGGSATVWTTCLVFFQTALLAGYTYADWTVRRLAPRRAVLLHVALLAASLAVLPIVPGDRWKPAGDENPSWLILGMLAFTIGLPYFLLSTTSPLAQAWFARRFPSASPYRLFALSNLASMLALLGYPFLLEPWSATRGQAVGWSLGYVAFAALCAAAGFASLRGASARHVPAGWQGGGHGLPLPVTDPAHDDPPPAARQLLWCTLAATASILLLAVSNHITQNIASVPLLWIVPLALYLLTFILTFDGTGWYRRDIVLSTTAAVLGVMAWTLADPSLTHELEIQVGVFCTGLFLACMFCHGELTRIKPSPRFLTRFYLMISLGGAVGAVLVGILAPLLLPAHFELPAGLVLCGLLLLWQVRRDYPLFGVLGLASLAVTVGCAIWGTTEFYRGAISVSRNFYGVLRVQEADEGSANHRRSLIHGTILHGNQYLDPVLRRQATTYYTKTSGVGRALESLHPRTQPLRVAVIGLGTGSLAVYGAKGDTYRFYEINPDVVDLARRDFSYLADSEANVETALGDARLVLEREPAQGFDLLAIDAFSSDSIPVHLITREALAIYLKHVKPDGLIAFHVTNRFLDLVPVVDALAKAHGLAATWIEDSGEAAIASRSDWVLLSRDAKRLAAPLVAEVAQPLRSRDDWRLWTDDFNNLVQVLK